MNDSLDVLFGKFVGLASGLPNDATLWSITLCSQFLNSLAVDLREEMEQQQFKMPLLTNLGTKKAQLEALQIVRDGAVSAFKSLLEHMTLMKRTIQQKIAIFVVSKMDAIQFISIKIPQILLTPFRKATIICINHDK